MHLVPTPFENNKPIFRRYPITRTEYDGIETVIEDDLADVSPDMTPLEFGWSAYCGILAVIGALTSAVTWSVYFSMEDIVEPCENTIPLKTDTGPI